MPEAYTHIRIARAALNAAHTTVPCQNAFETGAQGPDPLLCAHAMPGRTGNLPALARRMHTQDCGAFLVTLLQNAQTPAQRSYALGFLLHYAADTALHPYVLALSAQGGPYDRPFGHGFCEAALDTYFYEADQGARAIALRDKAPALHTAELAEVCALLKKTVRTVYGQDAAMLDLSDALHLFRLGHRHTASRFGGKKLLARTADLLLGKRGCLLSHTTPQKPPQDGFPAQWTHPETGEPKNAGPHALCMLAVKNGAAYLAAADSLWQDAITPAQCWRILGSNSYFTGLPCRKEPAAQTGQPAQAAQAAPTAQGTSAAQSAPTVSTTQAVKKIAPLSP